MKFHFIETTIAATLVAASLHSSAQVLEEVVVTAQKREESLQKSPVAVQAMAAEALDKAGIGSMEDLELMSPSLLINSGTGNMQPVIRGVGSNLSGGGGYSSIATYVDGAYIPRMTSTNAALGDFDLVESVQVLKGPQGTLYGRNATGGAIVVTTPTPHPDDELRLRIKATLGDYGMQKYMISAAGGLTETLAASASYASSDTDGYIENTGYTHKDDFELQDRETWRLKLVAQPTDRLELVLSGLYAESFDRFHGSQQVSQFDSELHNSALNGFGVNNPQAFFFATANQIYNPTNDPATAGLLLSAAQALEFTNNYGEIFDNAVGAYQSGRGLLDNALSAKGTASYTEDVLSTFKFTYGFDTFDVVGITSYNDTQSDLQVDILRADPQSIPDATANLLPFQNFSIGFSLKNSGHSIAQELHLVSTDSPIDWIVGLTYFDEVGDNVLVQDPFDISFYNAATEWEVETKSIFGEVGIPFGDNWKAILGARYTEEDLTLVDKIDPSNPYTIPGIVNLGTQEQDDSQATYTAKLIYQSDDWMVYGGVTTGFKGGNLNVNNPITGGVDPEKITSVEVGFKSEWLDHTLRINGNIFSYDYKNLQLDVVEPNTGSAFLIDGAEAEISGLELETQYLLADNLTVFINTAFLDHEYTTDAEVNPIALGLPASTIPLQGNDMAMTSDFVATTGFDYLMPWVTTGGLALNLNARYNSGYWIDQRNLIGSQGSGDNGSFVTVNINLKYTSADEKWSVALWGNNIFDEEYYSGGFVIADGLGQNVIAASPAWFGMTAEVTF